MNVSPFLLIAHEDVRKWGGGGDSIDSGRCSPVSLRMN